MQGGVEKHCEELYPRIAAQGHTVIVFARAPYVGKKEYRYKGIQILPLSCPKHKFCEAFFHTLRGVLAARRLKPDILHIHAIGPSLFVPFAKLLGLRVAMTHHGPDYKRVKWNWIAKLVLRIGEFLGIVFSNAVIGISQTILKQIEKLRKKGVFLIPNGVVIPEILKTNNALQLYHLESEKYILAVGRFVPEKGFGDLIDAYTMLQGRGTAGQCSQSAALSQRHIGDWKLVIVGDADHEDVYSVALKQKAAQNSQIVLTGFLSGKPLQELYSHAGLFILPSYYEGLPIVLLEALSYGLSCIVSDIPANREVPIEKERFFPAGDISALAEKIQAFIQFPLSDSQKLAQQSMISARYNWDTIAQEMLSVYKSL